VQMSRHRDGSYQSFRLGPDQDPGLVLPRIDGPALSESDIQRARDAVALVMNDVHAELGAGAVTVVVGASGELHDDLTDRGLGWISSAGMYGWVHANDGSGIGIWFAEDSTWPDVVVSVADVIQEGILEGAEHWGVAFPRCREHPNHPMNAEVISGVASWVCPRGEGTPIQIGELHPTNSAGSGSGSPYRRVGDPYSFGLNATTSQPSLAFSSLTRTSRSRSTVMGVLVCPRSPLRDT
jgi:hypothetical protein